MSGRLPGETVAQHIVRIVSLHPDTFKPDFGPWLAENAGIWTRFEFEANRVRMRGRRHYSARTIGEFLRHETALREHGDAVFKVNDHAWPDCARLYMLLYPQATGFFEMRGRS